MAECGLTQKDVALCLHIAPATVSQKINGVRPLHLDEAENLANILRIDSNAVGAYFFTQ